ncbi:alcohol dehydrogenase zinc-binding domain protein [Aphanothece sacrum FPU1]|uniref:Alcohol dehydrogenase zinc-binding domain protein n=1 Tax=Aphanothece sacrum FPU1 TaxID=1920663 RepID=A0A401IG03_APHSA|nr:alcohol dehydrogenase zinc-binding domain protein [Aphanothece sacrum FPU1]GBF86042.1 alcohol dehydrogenase zinc-binding domain protein [Aphanothece sacrum FPU3]
MKAIIINAPGTPDVLTLQEISQPKITIPTQILVKIKAAGLNPIDTKIRQRGTFYPEQMPAILGCDGAGIVQAVGSQVQEFKPGDEVYFCGGGLGQSQTGNYAEFTVTGKIALIID